MTIRSIIVDIASERDAAVASDGRIHESVMIDENGKAKGKNRESDPFDRTFALGGGGRSAYFPG